MIEALIIWALLPLPIAFVLSLLWTQVLRGVIERRQRFKPDYDRIAEVERDTGILNGGYRVDTLEWDEPRMLSFLQKKLGSPNDAREDE